MTSVSVELLHLALLCAAKHWELANLLFCETITRESLLGAVDSN
jgi:hypothetical protein